MHQESALSPLIVVVFMDTISEEFGQRLRRALLFADDLVVVVERDGKLQKNWLKWKRRLANQEVNVNTGKTEVTVSSNDMREVTNVVDRGIISNCIKVQNHGSDYG